MQDIISHTLYISYHRDTIYLDFVMISGYFCASKVSKLGHQIYNIVVSTRIYLNDVIR